MFLLWRGENSETRQTHKQIKGTFCRVFVFSPALKWRGKNHGPEIQCLTTTGKRMLTVTRLHLCLLWTITFLISKLTKDRMISFILVPDRIHKCKITDLFVYLALYFQEFSCFDFPPEYCYNSFFFCRHAHNKAYKFIPLWYYSVIKCYYKRLRISFIEKQFSFDVRILSDNLINFGCAV